MTNIDKIIEEFKRIERYSELVVSPLSTEEPKKYSYWKLGNDKFLPEEWLRKALLDIQKETAREKTCCCISYERGVTPCLCGCHKQLTGEDYE